MSVIQCMYTYDIRDACSAVYRFWNCTGFYRLIVSKLQLKLKTIWIHFLSVFAIQSTNKTSFSFLTNRINRRMNVRNTIQIIDFGAVSRFSVKFTWFFFSFVVLGIKFEVSLSYINIFIQINAFRDIVLFVVLAIRHAIQLLLKLSILV